MMLEIFFGGRIRPPIERAVIEAGVGGRLDPTRVIPHATTVIARLGLDHEALLGNTLPAIAREKFGAIDPEGFVVHMPFAADEAERAAIAAVAEEFKIRLGGRWVEAPTYPSRVDASEGEPRWILQTPWGEAQLALLGERAVENTSLALAVLRELGLLRAEMLGALARVNWPGRMERFDVQGRRVYLSGDHNPQGISSLAEIIAHFRYDRLHIVAGIGAHKDAREILARLAALPRAHVHLTPTPFRSSRLEDLRAYAPLANSIDESPRKAIERALAEGKPDDLIVVTGSLYLVGAVRSQLVNHHWT
jgi:dihydrofolate synthase/folylpolyglutamate synthase